MKTSDQSLAQRFGHEPRSERAGSHVVVARVGNHWLCKDQHGRPCLLVKVNPTNTLPTPRRLHNLEIQHVTSARLMGDDAAADLGCTTIITCSSEKRRIVEIFLNCVEDLSAILGASPTAQACVDALDTLAELFSLAAGGRSAQGLWGELLVLASADDIDKAVRAWRLRTRSLFDFHAEGVLLDVKSTTRAIRRHRFRLEQVRPAGGAQSIIMSLMLQESRDGHSLAALAEEVLAACTDPKIRLQIQHEVASATVTGANPVDIRFDRAMALRSLKVYRGREIPAPHAPAGVDDVHFTADLSATADAGIEALPRVLQSNYLDRVLQAEATTRGAACAG